jgi:hypothetical protein
VYSFCGNKKFRIKYFVIHHGANGSYDICFSFSMLRLRDVGIPVGLINAVTGFYNAYTARLRIGTKLTAAYLVSTGLLEG